jgi:hypothetical protein
MGERLFTTAMCIFAVFIIWQSYDYGILSSTITGPGFFPAIAGVLILLSAGTSLVMRFRSTSNNAKQEQQAALTDDAPNWPELLRAALLVGLTALFIVLAPYVGMIALTPVYIFACFLVLASDYSPSRLLIGVLTAFLFTLAAWAIFDKGLGVPMPRGPF